MKRLVDAQLPTPREADPGQLPPGQGCHRLAVHLMLLHLPDQLLDVIAHQVQLMDIIVFCRMDGKFRGRQAEDQPTFSGIDPCQAKYISQEGSIRLRIRTIDEHVSADDHGFNPFLARLGSVEGRPSS
jgi:hypothetical protein